VGFSYFYLGSEDKNLVTASQGTVEHKLSVAPNLPPTEGHVWYQRRVPFFTSQYTTIVSSVSRKQGWGKRGFQRKRREQQWHLFQDLHDERFSTLWGLIHAISELAFNQHLIQCRMKSGIMKRWMVVI